MSNKTDSTDANQEQTFSIQPHPAKSNNPADLQNPDLQKLQQGGLGVLNTTPGIVLPSGTLPKPLSREELEIAQAQLNQAQSNSEQ